MRVQLLKLAALFAWAAAVDCSEDFGAAVEARGSYSQGPATTPSRAEYSQLAHKLSKNAQIYEPGSDSFAGAVARWSNASTPVASVVVVPGTEKDVVEIVKFATKNSVPFLTTNGVHGSITTLGKMTRGIEIYMGQMNSINIARDGKTATIGGGVISRNLTDKLWAAGKQAVTGTCECVSYLGPALGGGHGWLQGRHGLISDQIVSLNVVLANGKLVKVDRSSKLFWAMKGAGHNFGVITSVTSKIYDLQRPNYAMKTLFFSGDKVEDVYRTANEQWLTNGKTNPVDIINWSYWFFDPTLDAKKPVIAFYIIQEGVKAVDAKHTAAFEKLGPILTQDVAGTYLDLGKWTGISLADGPCQKTGNANPRFPIYLKSYDTRAQRRIYDLFSQITTNASTPFSGALFMFEGYSQQGVKAISKDATAFAYREDNLLVAPLLTYKPTGPDVEKKAHELGNQLRQMLYEGSGEKTLHTYVNYAYGDETAKSWYGSDTWRQSRLQSLKSDFDPKGQFSFYAPIA